MNLQSTAYYKWLYIFIALAVAVNFSGLFITIIGPDGTYYAGIAKTMVWRHDFVNLYVQGTDFLDKPHFPFWITALSYELFGIKTWAYKLPGILFMLMGALYTYRFAIKLYQSKEVALWSVLILLTAEHIIISSNDVRAEPYLTGLIIASIYHFYRTTDKTRLGHLLLASMFAAMAIMTKGMFALIPIGGAIGGHLLITRAWPQLFHWRWLLAIILISVMILPEVYCLNVQFDSHPEKVVFGQHAVSGIKWFLWDSQIGRFFNNGPIKGNGDPFFFVHTLLWAFLPWSLLLFACLFWSIKANVKQAQRYQWHCLCGSLLTFLVFSASKFQLPYYLNIVFPLFAIQLAYFLRNLKKEKSLKAVNITQRIVMTLLLVVIMALQYFFKPGPSSWTIFAVLAVLLLIVFRAVRKTSAYGLTRTMLQTVAVAFFVNLYLNLVFYPALLHYQSGSEAAFYINQHNTNNLPVAQTGDNYNFPLEFYLNKPLITIDPNGHDTTTAKPFILYGDHQVIEGLRKQGWKIRQLSTFNQYWISMLKPKFLNAATRSEVVTHSDVVLVTP
ncbi:4-amino-4-deoxy-L-arabinose transferase-like glycosyltransferase [Mucilaginibacter yixingensis]|uniref:4-amino-4-deoxy-L-arabinose transferase-like glycosyltransferase n=1 Tax=Mucilaginibacter yixingensis TaxID=1295612 RepID=A0A2T5JDI8_9SPHI|nr:glycosyltransferase family 39 protein [Mucilaginibacter yixingensis]PTQ99813.1 4-amino-4-deoxy-L-arabinose transferase-like glycosyltransferase [Mucilaginibacter yixingensis]